MFFYSCVVIDIFDKNIVGRTVHDEGYDRPATELFERSLQGKTLKSRILQNDNGNPVKGIILMALLSELNVEVAHNRPRISNDNPFIESLFKTLQYRIIRCAFKTRRMPGSGWLAS